MKLATLSSGAPDGTLVVVSTDGARFVNAASIAPTLQAAIENWATVEPLLRALTAPLDEGGGDSVDTVSFAAPLPRAWQWLDGSAFASHGALMQKAFDMAPIETGLPLMYQGLSHQFLGPNDDVPFPSEADGIDFEGEYGVITDAVPMGVNADDALDRIRLIIQINDWSLRTLAPYEMKTGFGWVQAKPACSAAPFAVTPDELGVAWHQGRVGLPLVVDWNGERFGSPNGEEMAFGFHELIAHAARTRSLPAGTIIGSGTVSNENYRAIGSSCIAERRGIEIVDSGQPLTPYMRFGESVQMEARSIAGAVLFGKLDQRVVPAFAQTTLQV
jgi:fumarylacetoacetate (FAA) hydrolase